MSRRIIWAGGPQPLNQPSVEPDSYLGRVGKLIPGESTAAYVAVTGAIATSTPPPSPWLEFCVFLFILAFTPLYVRRACRDAGGTASAKQVAITSAAFVVWALAVGNPFLPFGAIPPIVCAISLPLFTFAMGVL